MRVALTLLPEVRELIRDDPEQLAALVREIHDEDLADLLKALDEHEGIILLENLDDETAGDVFERLEEREQFDLLQRFGAVRLAPIVASMAPDDRADLIDSLPDLMGDRLMGEFAPDVAAEVEELMRWPDDTAGGLMTTDLVRLSPSLTINEVIGRLRGDSVHAETINYIYGVETDGRLSGVASLRDIILADGCTSLREVMSENVLTILPETDQEEVARSLKKYDFTAIPVADAAGRLLGLITVDDVLDVIEEEQDEDVQKLGAVAPIEEDYFQTSFVTFLQKRAPWLGVLFFGQFFTEAVLRHYDPVIQAVTQLTYYLPMLVSTGGNSGAQSATLIIRGMATGDITQSDWLRVLRRELGQGLVLGLLLGGIGASRVWYSGDVPGMAATVAVTVVAIVVMGCTVGAMLPILLRRVGLDPATSSTPFIATIVDVIGILLYFTIANWLLVSALSKAGVAGSLG